MVGFNYNYTIDEFNDEELDVADIFLEFPHLFAESETTILPSSISWGVKRRRTEHHRQHQTSSLSSSPTRPIVKRRRTAIDESKKSQPCVEIERSSPKTTLMFPLSDSDSGSKLGSSSARKSYKKMNYTELMQRVKDLTEVGETLKQEGKKVRMHYEKLRDENLLLKGQMENQTELNPICLDLTMNLPENIVNLQCQSEYKVPDLNIEVEQPEEKIVYVPPPPSALAPPLPIVYVSPPAPIVYVPPVEFVYGYDPSSKAIRRKRMEKILEKRASKSFKLRRGG
ncbi:hypothetical protein GIB67_033867 [Kingdonia uniflora]|uniref:Uncharacterized protein n=1 Tax=Kingdonia uniflora TaxID=39325 RepID=A0A7J7MJD9_9MAGN|nr:hypothetical protein GIB67_033867 [Kingdonia uniflora]